jgi:DNA-binding winged helix-turn-helix (wHTH) protein
LQRFCTTAVNTNPVLIHAKLRALMANVHSPAMVRTYRFGPYELDPAGELRKFDSRIKIQKKPFLLLLALVERPGDIMSRSELQERLWPGTYVDFEQNLNIAVKKVRDALCDTTNDPKFIETIPGQGYRFLAPVERVKPAQDIPAAETGPLAPHTGTRIHSGDSSLVQRRHCRSGGCNSPGRVLVACETYPEFHAAGLGADRGLRKPYG